MKRLQILLVGLIAVSPALAQVPGFLWLSGTDQTGTPIVGAYDFTEMQGPAQWHTAHDSLRVTDMVDWSHHGNVYMVGDSAVYKGTGGLGVPFIGLVDGLTSGIVQVEAEATANEVCWVCLGWWCVHHTCHTALRTQYTRWRIGFHFRAGYQSAAHRSHRH